MRLNDVDTNLKYLVLTLLILLPIGGAYNLSVDDSGRSFAMCDITVRCEGTTTGDICLGIQDREVACVNPETAPEYRRVEAECGLDAQGLCNANPELSGLEWTQHPNASYSGKTCSQWAEEDDRIDLLKCEQTFNDITQWSGDR